MTLPVIPTSVPHWWVCTSCHSWFSLFQPIEEISPEFLRVKSPLCRTCCIFVVSVLILLKQNNFYFWFGVNLGKSSVFKSCVKKNKISLTPEMLVISIFYFIQAAHHRLSTMVQISQPFIFLKVSEKQDSMVLLSLYKDMYFLWGAFHFLKYP